MCKLLSGQILVLLLFVTAFAEVDKHTGNMVFNETIATVSSQGIKFPVTITGRSNIKTNQRASWVGLGFNLEVPYIERIANGSADEKSYAPESFDQLVDHKDCFQPGVFDLSRVWDPLLKPAGNGYQGQFELVNTCAGTDYAEGYHTEMNATFASLYNNNYDMSITVTPENEIKTTVAPYFVIGTTNRNPGVYPPVSGKGALRTWLGINCTPPNPPVQGVRRRTDFNYTDEQDMYFLNAFFGSGRIVFKSPSYQTITPAPGNTFNIYNQAEVLVPYLQNYRKFIITIEYNNPAAGVDPDIIKWTIKDESGTEYIFDKTVVRYNAEPANLNNRTFGAINSHYTNGELTYLKDANGNPIPAYPIDERTAYPNKT